MKKKKSLLPLDFRDYLSIISILGFIAIFSEFTLDNSFLSESLTSLFLIIGGAGLMISGKVLSIKDWIKDGVQQNEVSLVLTLIGGLASIIIGFLTLFGIEIMESVQGIVGFIALAPATFILIDYIAKNT